MPIAKDEPGQDLDPVRREVQQYSTLKDEVDAINDRVKTLRSRLTAYIEDLGAPNEKGSIVLPINDERTGVKSIIKQRRVSKQFDQETAESLLKEKGLFDTCTESVVVLNQDAVMAAYYEGKLTDADIEAMFPESVSWALILEKK